MSSSKNQPNSIEKWLETLFLDPLTSFLDEAAFRVDLFESYHFYIIEALIPPETSRIMLFIKENEILIQVDCEGETISRQINWPFDVRRNEVKAIYANGILEVNIEKEKSKLPLDRVIKIRKNS